MRSPYLLFVALAASLSSAAEAQSLRFDPPSGFCAIDPDGGDYRATLWRAFSPPPQRNAVLQRLQIDCETLASADAGRPTRPRRVLTLLKAETETGLPSSLEAYLDTLQRRFSAREPLQERFWQNPPQPGAPVLGRDAIAVYVAQRQLGAGGAIATAGVSAYTLLGGAPMILNILMFDGSDVTPLIQTNAAAVVRSLHGLPPGR